MNKFQNILDIRFTVNVFLFKNSYLKLFLHLSNTDREKNYEKINLVFHYQGTQLFKNIFINLIKIKLI